MHKCLTIMLSTLWVLTLTGKSLELARDKSDVLSVRFTLPEFYYEPSGNGSNQNDVIRIRPADSELWHENMAGYPQIESFAYIPAGYEAAVSLENELVEEYSGSGRSLNDTKDQAAEWLDVSQTMSLRGHRILSFCLKPFRYGKTEDRLMVLKQAVVKIKFTPADNVFQAGRLSTPGTEGLLKSLCINGDDLRTTISEPGSYVILYNGSNLLNIVQPLADWKHEKGYSVHLVNTATIGNNTTAIKNYLQTAYNTWDDPPEFILLLGRGGTGTNNVPTYTESFNYNTVGDYKYTLLDGTDIIPDAFIGRITFASTDELQTAINRLISYEKMQNLNATDWQNKTFLLADISTSGPSCYTTINHVKGLIQDYNTSADFIEAYAGSFPSQINAAFNSGIGTYFYRGHGDFSGWTVNDISNLNNSGKYPFFTYITCFTGNFGSSNASHAERLLRLGTPTAPRGAIGVISASCETHTCLNNIVTAGTAFGLYMEGLTQGGPAMVRGKLALMANYPQNPANYIGQYMQAINLIGDPGLDIWLRTVNDIVVSAPSELNISGGSIAVQVQLTDRTPVEGAWVCLTKGSAEVFVSGYTNSNGWVVLNHGTMTGGIAKLTVTKPNHKTFQNAFMAVTDSSAVGLSGFPGLNQIYAGSIVEFNAVLTNSGSNGCSDVSAVLQTLTGNVTVIQDSSFFGTLLPDSTAVSQTQFQIQINPDTPKGSQLHFNLQVTHANGSLELPFTLTENGANLGLVSAVFANGLADHGTDSLSFTLHNLSSASVSGLQALLEDTHPLVNVVNPNLSIGTVAGDITLTLPQSFSIDISDSLMDGTLLSFNLHLYNANGFVQTITLNQRFGSPSANDVTGPDDYGYICYGPGDEGYIPYNWIELDPTQGGNGIYINVSDTNPEGGGISSLITLPFQFRFYGMSYSQLSICTNGFLIPGSDSSIEWMNWQIPGPMVPRPIVAPFWDDLITDSMSRLMYIYDTNLHAEIIQWQNYKNRFSPNSRETFQVILYDPVYYSTPTGDSPILFQYKLFNNVDSGNYGVDYIDHGQYATIGIGDHTGTTGIEYTYNNTYPQTATALSHQSTLFFTTLPTYQTTPEPVIMQCLSTELTGNGNGSADAGESFNLSFLVKNIGIGAIAESQVILLSADPHVSILQNQASLPSLISNEMQQTAPAFTIGIDAQCANLHVIRFILRIENSFNQYELPFELLVHALQFNALECSYTDGNNDFAEPGEIGQIQFRLQNLSLLDASAVSVSIVHSPEITVSPLVQAVSIPAQGIVPVSFNVMIDPAVTQGASFEIGIRTYVESVYDSVQIYPLLVGVPEPFLITGFEESDLSEVFQSAYNISLMPSQYINPTGQEAHFIHNYMNPYSYAYCYPLDNNDLLAARVKFTWYSNCDDAEFYLMALYPNQSFLISLWHSADTTAVPRTENILLTDFQDATDYVILVFVVNFTGPSPGLLALDDLSILSLHHSAGYIEGNVSLDLFPENVTNVQISLQNSNLVYHPDELGNYSIPAYQGINVIYAYLDGYLNTVDSLAVNVISNQVSSGNDLFFQRLRAPANLSYALDGYDLTLNWELEGPPARAGNKAGDKIRSRFLTPDYYRIWFRCNNINFQDTTSELTYYRSLYMYGEYQIYVCSVFLLNGEEETYSTPSEYVTFLLTGNQPDDDVPPVFSLQQNYPNPFGPETRIDFTLPEKSRASLTVYNLKGQAVKTLQGGELSKGKHHAVWDGTDEQGAPVAAGIYYCRLRWNGREQMRKMILLK